MAQRKRANSRGSRKSVSRVRKKAATGLPKPVQVVDGLLRLDGDRSVLDVNGLRLELIAGPVPVGDAALKAARRATLKVLQPHRGGTVTVHGRQDGPLFVDAIVISGRAPKPDARFAKIADVIKRRSAELLANPSVIGVRPGYRFRNGWITKEPCIVAIVRQKLDADSLPAAERLPASLDGVTIDVAPADPIAQYLADSGRSVPHQVIANPLGLAVPLADQLEPELVAPEMIRKEKYVAPTDVTLSALSGPMDILCHTSPDAGWPTLKAFLSKTEETLTVAMYDFTAPHIEQTLETTFAKGGQFDLILDPGESLTAGGGGKNPKASDQHETVIRDDLISTLGQRFEFTWAAVKRSGKTDAGIFPTAYHIKVAVRDSGGIWLSSGNWQSSNQPNLDPLNGDANLPGLQRIYNREWHVVTENEALATTYEKFIKWDISQAEPLNVDSSHEARPDLLVAQAAFAQAAQAPQFFAPKTITLEDGEQVMPLLTPDNYAENVIPLIAGAKRSIRFQNQYINIGKEGANPPKFVALLNALKDRIDAGLDVKIILRDIGNPRAMLEALQSYGIDTSNVRLQSACHNKGIVVDDAIVCLGSHNWSGDGTCYNRDASLIFHSPAIAAYYAQIFDYDWKRLAKAQAGAESAVAPQLASSTSRGTPETARIPWDAYYGEQRGEIDAAIDRAFASAPPVAGFAVTQDARGETAASPGYSHSDLNAAKAEMTERYLTSERARAIYTGIEGRSAQPEINVYGVGIAEKISDGGPTGVRCIKFYVERKYARGRITPEHLLPDTIAGIPTDVEEVGTVKPFALALPNPKLSYTPARPGSSVGFREKGDKMAGTFGALVRDEKGQLYVLSNCHVLADEGRLARNAPIYQCGLLDLPEDQQARQIAKLSRFVDYKAPLLKVDCAVAALLSPSIATPDILYIGKPAGTAVAADDMVVHKYGRSSAYQAGRVTSVNANITVPYDTGYFTFYDQIVVESTTSNPFSEPGDSGSLVLERASHKAVGLLFAGSPTHTYVNHISDVLSALNVTLV